MSIKLSLKFYPQLDDLQLSIVEELSFHTTKLYNIANYECREHGFKFYYELEKMFKSNWHNEFLHSHTYQQLLKVLEQDWKSFFVAVQDYKVNPHKYKGIPKPPRYKNMQKRKNQIIFTNFAIRVKGNTLMLSLSKKMQSMFNVESLNFVLPESVQKHINMDALQQVRITWDNSRKQWYLLIIYKAGEHDVTENFHNVMAIDLGLDNLCAITFKDSEEQYLINGKPLKSRNAYYNKEMARLTSVAMKQTGSSNFRRTKQIRTLQKKRNNYVNDYLHKVSRLVINLALEHKCHTIIIGDIRGIKQESHAKSFVQIPIQRLAEQIKYKAELVGIKVKLVKETYTSGVSAYDLEPITKKYYNKNRRVQRGLFRTNQGYLVSSDINGSLNILRKYLKDKVVPKPIVRWRDKGILGMPVRIRVA